MMKASRLSGALFAAVLLCAVSAFADNTVKKSLQINETVTVGTVQLAPGSYRVEWNEPGPNVEVKIMQKGETVATVPAHMVQENTSNEQDGYGTKPGLTGDKYQRLSELFFHGEKYDLQLDQGSQGNNAGTSGTAGMVK
jgi:hypothetical protein